MMLLQVLIVEEPSGEPKETKPANLVMLKTAASSLRDSIVQVSLNIFFNIDINIGNNIVINIAINIFINIVIIVMLKSAIRTRHSQDNYG